MASNGIENKAKHGKCRICQRVRNTNNQVKAVGEVHHGFATGHIWECIDIKDCDKVAATKLADVKTGAVTHAHIKVALERGRFSEYLIAV